MESQWKSSRAIKISDDQFKVDLEEHGTLKLAKIYGVSKNTIADKRKQLGIPSKYTKQTTFRIEGDTAFFTTKKGIEFRVDAEDAEKLRNLTWYISNLGYVICDSPKRGILLHRFVMGAEKGFVVDHINHDILDNRKCNLRVVTQMENNMNKRIDRRNKSTVKGVSWTKANQKWMAYITVKSKRLYLGYYDTLEEAKEVRLKAEEEHHGEYAYKQ